VEQVHKEVVTKYEESVVSKCLEMPELLRQQTNIIVNLATFDTICYLFKKVCTILAGPNWTIL